MFPLFPKPTGLVHFSPKPSRLVLPDTSVDLVWADGRVDVVGPMTVARPGRYPVGQPIALMALAPHIASDWLDTPLAVLTDRVVELRDIAPRLASAAAAFFDSGALQDATAQPCSAPTRKSRAAVAASHLLAGASVAQAAATVNLGERQFARWFQQLMGMPPKRFQTVARFRRAILATKRGMTPADAAAACGYADQAHFARSTRELTGGTLRAVLPHVGNVQDIGDALR